MDTPNRSEENDTSRWTNTDEEVAKSLGTTPEDLPFLPELLADLWVLGSWPKEIVGLLRPLALPPDSTRVLDLGCGKGAVGITLAHELGFHVLGVDLFQPFLQEARRRAEELDVVGRCQFQLADLHQILAEARGFDIVLCAGGADLLGTLEECVTQLRRSVRPGGYTVIDGGFLAGPAGVQRAGYEHYVPHAEAVRQLTAHGDNLVQEVVIPAEAAAAVRREDTERVRKRATRLMRAHPEAADLFRRYVEDLEEEFRVLDTATVSAIWLLRRAG